MTLFLKMRIVGALFCHTDRGEGHFVRPDTFREILSCDMWEVNRGLASLKRRNLIKWSPSPREISLTLKGRIRAIRVSVLVGILSLTASGLLIEYIPLWIARLIGGG